MSLPKIFINYRIKDTAYQADFLYDFLRQYLPKENLFMDIEGIPEGENFEEKINYVLNNTDIVLVLIGHYWEKEINNRIDNNLEDWVVDEIVESIDGKKTIIPIAFDRTELPIIDSLKITARRIKNPIAAFLKIQMFQISRRNKFYEIQRLAEERLKLEKLPIVNDIQSGNQGQQTNQKKITELENTLAEKNKTIEELEADITQAMSTVYDLKNKPETELNTEEDLQPYQETVNGVTFKMMPVKGGSFMMGSEIGDASKPIHKVNLQSFYMAETQVTQELYEAVIGENPSKFEDKQNPVENVSWKDAQKFCQELTKITGNKYHLPSEAQWEFAARGGVETRFIASINNNPPQQQDKFAGTTAPNQLQNYAWFKENSEGKTHPVKTKKPNELDIYDMSGNVWEWCEDKWHENYNDAPEEGEAWIEDGNSFRVLRGGSWLNSSYDCRVAYRSWVNPDSRINDDGFRVIRSVP